MKEKTVLIGKNTMVILGDKNAKEQATTPAQDNTPEEGRHTEEIMPA